MSADVEVPELGDVSSSTISPLQEYELGQMVLKLYRSQMPTSSDPVMYSYLENLLTDLADFSQLNPKSFDLLVIDNSTINAFAVPGRVIGVHNGIFLYAESEGQLAAVLSHELAHLSQRHYARSLEQQKKATLPTMAGLLAGIVLMAAGGGDAGMAAISATQAAALDHRLRFGRSFEQEADRIGIQNLAAAGYDPNAAAEMFEAMLKATRYSRRPPEFLSTHPIHETRIADARNRARNLKPAQRDLEQDSLDFHLMAARSKLRFATTPQEAVKRFESEIQGQTLSREASQYGLVLALTESGQVARAREAIKPLVENRPDKIIYRLAEAEVEAKAKNYRKAIAQLDNLLTLHPDDHATTVTLAEILMEAGEHARCEALLQKYARVRPKNDYVWYLLAEAHGLMGNILQVHRARAEYFILTGVFDRAKNQLENAHRMAPANSVDAALIEQRLRDVDDMLEAIERL